MNKGHLRDYKVFIDKWLAGLLSGVRGKTSISNHIRRWLIETRGEKCEKCGWNQKHPVTGKVPVEIHHINGIWNNNRPENLQLLCPNCHSLTETFRSLNSSTRIRKDARLAQRNSITLVK